MMRIDLKGLLMPKAVHVLVCALLWLPAWSHSQSQSNAKSQTAQLSAAAKARSAADVAARLQAQAIQEAASRAALSASSAQPLQGRDGGPTAWSAAKPLPASKPIPKPTEVSQQTAVEPVPVWRAVGPSATLSPNAPAEMTTLKAVPAMLSPQPQSPPVALREDQPVVTEVTNPMSQEMAIAQQIHQGRLPCEMGASVHVEADATQPGYFHVHGKGFRYRMYPVRTSTGALRLEDKKAGAVWLQLANKSMLMDQKKGRRMADECAHPAQVAYGESMKTNPPPSLFDKTGMGRSND
jgi:hypothetical protein